MNEIAPLRQVASREATHARLHMTADEFLMWEGDGTGRKLQLIDGMDGAVSPASSPASSRYGIIQANLSFLILTAIEASSAPLGVVSEGAVIPALHATDNVRVPDLVVAPLDGIDDRVVVRKPIALVEILSPGNRSLTRNNVRAYATLPGVREILVVHTSRIELEVFRRDSAGAWPDAPETIKGGGRLRLHTVGLECPVERVYVRPSLGGLVA